MAITPHLINADWVDFGIFGAGQTFSTGNLTFTAGRWYLVSVAGFGTLGAGIAPGTPTTAGMSLTWVNAITASDGGRIRVDCFAAVGSSTSGALTFTYPTPSIARGMWVVSEWEGTATTSAIAPIRQSTASNEQLGDAIVYLGEFGATVNYAYGMRATNAGGGGFTPGVGYTLLGEKYTSSDNIGAEVKLGGTPGVNAFPNVPVPGPSGTKWNEVDWTTGPAANGDMEIALEIGEGRNTSITPIPGNPSGVPSMLRIPYYRPRRK